MTTIPSFVPSAVPNHWLPMNKYKDFITGIYCIARKPDGKLEACIAPGVWYEFTDQNYAEQLISIYQRS